MASFPRLRWLAALSVGFLSLALPASTALAGPKDGQADKAYKTAMEDDYLDSKFDDALKVLDKAIDACGDSGCSGKAKARLYMAKGIVLGVGKKKMDDAKAAFVDGLKLDASATPDADYQTAELKTAFEAAQKLAKKGGGGGGGGTTEPVESSGPLGHTPAEEQKVNTPLPIYVTVDDDIAKKVASVVVTYVGVGGGDSKDLKLEKSGKAYRGNIPCDAAKKKGKLKYWITAKDKNDKVIGSVGSEDSPNETQIKSSLDGKAPSWPGFAPPDQCAGGGGDEGGGGESEAELRAKSSLRQCVDSADCPPNEKCSQNECLLKPSSGDGGGGGDDGSTPTEPGKEKVRRHWISVSFQPDFDVLSGDEICTKNGQNAGNFVCLRPAGTGGVKDTSGQPAPSVYQGTPTAKQGDNITGGIGVGQMRLMIGYDGIPYAGDAGALMLGLRIGYAFNGTGAPASYIPAHVEAHGGWVFGAHAFTTAIARPWVTVGGGFGQFDSGVDVQVVEDGEVCGAQVPQDFKSPCDPSYTKAGGRTGTTRLQTLTAVKQAGLGFIDLGGGLSLLPAKMFAIDIGLKFTATVPVFVPVLSPSIGASVGF